MIVLYSAHIVEIDRFIKELTKTLTLFYRNHT